jgi:hypothetical protein
MNSSVGQTRVDLQHLLEDLRDAYTGALEETILTEIAANTLESGATRIEFRTDSERHVVRCRRRACSAAKMQYAIDQLLSESAPRALAPSWLH